MPITPLDLQTLFVKMGQVGKDQAHVQNASAVQQAARGREISQEELQKDQQVNETPEDREGEKVREKKDEDSGGKQGSKHRNSGSGEEESRRKSFQDPDVGRNVDISG